MSKTILITGANRGLGLTLSKQLAEAGHKVLMTARDHSELANSARNINGEIHTFQLDVRDQDNIKSCYQWVQENFEHLDVLVNNAGAVFDTPPFQSDEPGPLYSDLPILRESFELNIFAPYMMIRQFLPLLLTNDKRTDIINLSTAMAAISNMGTGVPAYRLSKAALNALTSYLQAECVGTQVTINSVCPGWCTTQLGGENAPRSPLEGIQSILWIIDREPDINGALIRDKKIIPF